MSRYIKAKSDISTFRQGNDEAFCDAWERFEIMLRRCLNHGFEDIAQLTIFHNGLRPDTKMILDVATNGTMMAVDVEQATRIIKALTSIDYKAQHDRHNAQPKKGMLQLSTTNALLTQNKILTQQMEVITKQTANLPKQLHAVQNSQGQNQVMRCDFCGGNHLNDNCFYQNQSEEETFYMSNHGRQTGFQSNYHNNMAPGWKNNVSQGAGWNQEVGPSNRQMIFQ